VIILYLCERCDLELNYIGEMALFRCAECGATYDVDAIEDTD
jgi:DNA-directed RNA polymerase subunit RPC12/RpoP